MEDDRIIVVSIACPNDGVAGAIGEALVGARLAACAQTHAIASIYRWKGEVERAREVMLTVKTTLEIFPALESVVRAGHPYEIPEIVATEVLRSNEEYARWVRECVERPAANSAGETGEPA